MILDVPDILPHVFTCFLVGREGGHRGLNGFTCVVGGVARLAVATQRRQQIRCRQTVTQRFFQLSNMDIFHKRISIVLFALIHICVTDDVWEKDMSEEIYIEASHEGFHHVKLQ